MKKPLQLYLRGSHIICRLHRKV